MTREQFENNTNWNMTYEELTYEEFQKYDCIHCNTKDYIYHGAFRRVPQNEYLRLTAV